MSASASPIENGSMGGRSFLRMEASVLLEGFHGADDLGCRAFAGWTWWHLSSIGGDATRALAEAKVLEFTTGYLVEKALAVDNLFAFLMMFTYFAVPAEFQKRALMIGIVGAIVLRAVMILVGAWLIARFHWVLYAFGAFLVFTGIKMWWRQGRSPISNRIPC